MTCLNDQLPELRSPCLFWCNCSDHCSLKTTTMNPRTTWGYGKTGGNNDIFERNSMSPWR